MTTISLVTTESLAAELERFVRKRFRVAADDSYFTTRTNLWDEGYVDSSGVVEVIAFLENRVERRLPEDLLFHPDFVSIAGMARLVAEGES